MNILTVPIEPVHLIPGTTLLQNILEKKQRFPYLPEPMTMLADLYELNQQGGIPAIMDKNKKGEPQLRLYTATYYLGLYQSTQQDGYIIAFLDTLNMREHERLSKGALRLQAQAWQMWDKPWQIPQGSKNSWETINKAWRQFEFQRQSTDPNTQQEELTPAHEYYLDTLRDLIEVTHQLEQDTHALSAGIPYLKVESVGDERDAPRDIYTFRLAELPRINEKTMLRIKDIPDLKGRLLSLEGTKLTLKFETLVDRRRIPERGSLEPTVSPLIYKKQHEAVEMLRTREAKNTHLLHVFVDQVYRPYNPDPIAQNSDSDLQLLTHEQFAAFRHALTVPDMLMVLGPPGTGKTRTITEITRYCGARHKRVLLASGTHKAVDNVLERMPEDLIIIRVGHESNISEKVRPHLIDRQAQKLQETLRENTEVKSIHYSRLLASKSEIDGWIQQLTNGLTSFSTYETQLQTFKTQCTATEQHLLKPFKLNYNNLAGALQHWEMKRSHAQKNLFTWSQIQVKLQTRRHLPVLGWILRFFLTLCISTIQRKQEFLQKTTAEIQTMKQQQVEVHKAGQRTLLTNKEFQYYVQNIQRISAICATTWDQILKVANELKTTIIKLVPQQPGFEPKSAATLRNYLSWYISVREPLESRARLLQDWRKDIEKPSEQLHPELFRYADVVGATCIGAATARGLEDIEFDLAIIDEAGQIALPDLLVPLVRAKRAVLVGDHHQLPPFVDSEVQDWLKHLSPQQLQSLDLTDDGADIQQVSDLLTKSAFEQLFTTKHDSAHIVRFTRQGRMPRIIADFASHYFYQDQLGTFDDEKMQHTVDNDPLFRAPFVVIDTADAPESTRWEQAQKTLERPNESGYTNIAEAMLIADIASVYEHAGKAWVIIVPYRAQARLIIRELKKRIEAHDIALEERVATVDSFQGGECNKVIYGFTRSNRHGKIGFLKELRRLNVAMTRAQQHLILVGNIPALTKAEDVKFGAVVTGLKNYVHQYGELLSYTACRHKLLHLTDERGRR